MPLSTASWAGFARRAALGGADEACHCCSLDRSDGGFGAYLMLSHNWASNQATKKSDELFARHVMPRLQGSVGSPIRAADRARESRSALAEKQLTAVEKATQRYEREGERLTGSNLHDEPMLVRQAGRLGRRGERLRRRGVRGLARPATTYGCASANPLRALRSPSWQSSHGADSSPASSVAGARPSARAATEATDEPGRNKIGFDRA